MTIPTISEIQKKNADEYKIKFKELKKKDPELAKKEARQELIKMGLFSTNGKRKKKIVSWD